MRIAEAITKRTNQLLTENNLTLYKLSQRSCVSKSTLENLYYGRTKCPSLALIFKISEGFNITVIDFLNCDLFLNNELELD